ncbi:MAG: SpoVR family protein [Deltaproteobacteria bacterium]|nr:SpoVR family protein [Deltaproteobacteria bacterium]
MTLPPHLVELHSEIRGYAEAFGLDCFDIVFELVTVDQMNMVAAYGGFPTRYPHWRFGMEYEQLSKSHEYGLSKIYELVINNDPCYAYLIDSNSFTEQKLVMAHVYGHCDFFKNNYYFAGTSRRMLDRMANHASRVRRYMDRYGVDVVEGFLDACLSIENLIDQRALFEKRKRPRAPVLHVEEDPQTVRLIPTDRSYLRDYINPAEFIEAEKKKLEVERQRKKRFPEHAQRDVLLFILENAPLELWEQDCLDIVREEAYYFAPQGQTKIMNEGWASYWHSRIMTTRALKDSEVVDYADSHAATMGVQPGRINPYKLGLELFKSIEERWNKGQFGKEWDEAEDFSVRQRWDKQLGLGRQKIFDVRKLHNDVTFIDEFLTEDFAREQKLFSYGLNRNTNNWEIQSREFKEIKSKLLRSLTNFGNPIIDVVDGNWENRGELLLLHTHDGVDLQHDWAFDTLANLNRLWRRPVAIATRVDDKPTIIRFDGKDHSEKAIGGAGAAIAV